MLTPAQREWEVQWASKWAAGACSMDSDAWVDTFYEDHATAHRPWSEPLEGKKALKAHTSRAFEALSKRIISQQQVTLDEELSILIITADVTISLAADPEKRDLPLRTVFIVKKELGTGEERAEYEEIVVDASRVTTRLSELAS